MLYPALLSPGFSTLDQLKRRNTLKDGIIMIQTLLIILFIIVPIFLLLDKVPTGTGEWEELWKAGRLAQGRQDPGGVPIFSDSVAAHPAPSLSIGSLFVHSFGLGDSFPLPLPHPDPHPWPIRGQRWRTLTL